MPRLTREFVLDHLVPWLTRREELIADCRECAPLAGERIRQLEEIRELAVEVGLSAREMKQIDGLLTELRCAKDLAECAEEGGSARIQ